MPQFTANSTLLCVARAKVGDIEAKTLNNQGGSYTHLYSFPTMPALPVLASVTPGSANVTAPASVTTSLNPGNYAAVVVKNTGTLRLTGGVYQVASVQVENDAKIEAAAPVQLRISGRRTSPRPSTSKAFSTLVASRPFQTAQRFSSR
jgi:hypothetical protein